MRTRHATRYHQRCMIGPLAALRQLNAWSLTDKGMQTLFWHSWGSLTFVFLLTLLVTWEQELGHSMYWIKARSKQFLSIVSGQRCWPTSRGCNSLEDKAVYVLLCFFSDFLWCSHIWEKGLSGRALPGCQQLEVF